MLPLRTSRLVLRDFVLDDLPVVHAYSTDEEVIRFMAWGPRTLAESRAHLDRLLAAQTASPRVVYELAIARSDAGEVIGACRLSATGEGEADLGYLLAREAWGHGYATEACRSLLDFGFGPLRLSRVVATCAVKNVASVRVMQRLGMVRARRLDVRARGQLVDSYEYVAVPP
jgi:RimJ/RimL family protein N-acetyltransferase